MRDTSQCTADPGNATDPNYIGGSPVHDHQSGCSVLQVHIGTGASQSIPRRDGHETHEGVPLRVLFGGGALRFLLNGNHDGRRRLRSSHACYQRHISFAEACGNNHVDLAEAGAGEAGRHSGAKHNRHAAFRNRFKLIMRIPRQTKE
jgi:hypothetical protein